MMLLSLVFLLVSLFHHVSASEMRMWDGERHEDWSEFPSWKAIVEPPSRYPGIKLTYRQVLGLAHEAYDQLEGHPKFTGTRLVAALFIPTNGKVYLSTQPKKFLLHYMTTKADKAPTWMKSVSGMLDQQNPTVHDIDADKNKPRAQRRKMNYWHAEDAAYYLYEQDDTAKSQSDKYPEGSIIATWGVFVDPSGKSTEPAEVDPCAGQRRPVGYSCRNIAERLGVQNPKAEFGKVSLAGEIAAVKEEAGSLEEDPDVELDAPTEAAIEQACGHPQAAPRIRGRIPQLQPQSSNGSCIYDPDTSPVPVITLDSLPVFESTTTVSTLSIPSSDATPTPSCSMQHEDPDQGITSEYCVCDSTNTLPLLTIASPTRDTQSCDYTSIPTSATITPKPLLPSPYTDLAKCQACTYYDALEASCSPIDNCSKLAGSVTVEAGTSGVHVGSLSGDALYTSISSALNAICPEVTQAGSPTFCTTESVTIGDIDYVQDDDVGLGKGELIVKVDASSYNLTSLRDAMIKTAALAAQNAADRNCHEIEYEKFTIGRRQQLAWWSPTRLFSRWGHGGGSYESKHKATFCSTISFAGVHYYGPYWRLASSPGAADYIDASWTFHVPPPSDFLCQLLEEAIDLFAVVEPEFAVEDIELGEEIKVLCEQAEEAEAESHGEQT